MGDMADWAVGECLDMDELYMRAQEEGWSDTEMYEEGLIDEQGYSYYRPMFSRERTSHQARGQGLCPKCGSKTIEKTGKFGKFYGCEKFPSCTGSRSF